MLAKQTSKSRLVAWLPALTWLKGYNKTLFTSDFIAGLTVAVMLVPQAMAYAMLAGLPPVIGLYASTLPLIVYAAFGSSRQLAVGPVAIVSLLSFSGVSALVEPGSSAFIVYAAVLALMVGLLQFFLGLLRAGFLTNFLSHAVISGFTSAAAIIIGTGQLKHLFGVELPASETVFETLSLLIGRLGQTNLPTLLIGTASVLVLIFFKVRRSRFPAPLLVVILASLAVYGFGLAARGVSIIGHVPAGFPAFSFPAVNSSTLQALLPTALTVSFVSFMESIAVARSIATKERYKLEANNELVGLGLANLTASLFSGYPVTGGFSRTAVNYGAGAKTPMASVVTALLVSLTVLFFTPLFYYLPKAVLAAIIIVAVYGLVDIKEALHLFKLRSIDGWTLLVSFVATLVLGIETGILVGLAFSLLIFIGRSAYPHTAELGYLPDKKVFRNIKRFPHAKTYKYALIVRVDARLYFANLAFLESRLNNAVAERDELRCLILDFSAVNDMDAVAIETLARYIDELSLNAIETHISSIKGPIRDLLFRAGWYEKYGEKIRHASLEQALAACNLKG